LDILDWFRRGWNASDNEKIFDEWHKRLSQCAQTFNLGIDIQQLLDQHAQKQAAQKDAQQMQKLIKSLSEQSSNQHMSMKHHVHDMQTEMIANMTSIRRRFDDMKMNTNTNTDTNLSFSPPTYSSISAQIQPMSPNSPLSPSSSAILIPYSNLRFDKLLGRGSFGEVS
jgi:hypothetical protein